MNQRFRRHTSVLSFFLALLLPLAASAQTGVKVAAEYEKLIASRTSVTSLGSDLFGDEVNLYTGTVEFRQVDVSLPGNTGLPVEIARRFVTRQWINQQGYFADWELEIPHLQGIFAGGWITSNSPSSARCTQYAAPPAVNGPQGGTFAAAEFWAGNFLVLPGGGGGEILKALPGTPLPTDGQTYPLSTRDGVVFRCFTVGSVEYFEAVTPDGTRYQFDHQATRSVRRLEKTNPNSEDLSAKSGGQSQAQGIIVTPQVAGPYFVNRTEYWIMPSVVTDRFGNTVTYNWDGTDPWKLLSIQGSDGRTLTINYVSGTRRISSVSDGTRTWTYGYTTVSGSIVRLSSVSLPDSSQWTFSLNPLRGVMHDPLNSGCDIGGYFDPTTGTGIMTHPSGAQGSFTVAATQHGRSYVPLDCRDLALDSQGYAYYPSLFWFPSITSKTLSGPGISNQTWSYSYGAANNCWLPSAAYAWIGSRCAGGSPTTKEVSVTAPDTTVRGGDVAATFSGLVDDIDTLTSSKASVGERALAAASLASEALPISIGDAKDAVRIVEKAADKLSDAYSNSKAARGAKPIADIAKKIKQFEGKSLRDQKSVYGNLTKTYEKHLEKYGQKPGSTSGETNRMERELAEMRKILERRGVQF